MARPALSAFLAGLALGGIACIACGDAAAQATAGTPIAPASTVLKNELAPTVPPLVRLDPTEVRAHPTLARGCWVWMFPHKNYKGPDDIAIAGPVAVRSLHTPVGLDWKEKTESLIVGPEATVTVFETNEFGDRQAVFRPGSRVTALRQKLRFTQSIDSLKIACRK